MAVDAIVRADCAQWLYRRGVEVTTLPGDPDLQQVARDLLVEEHIPFDRATEIVAVMTTYYAEENR